ncbi:hypothetical protein DWG18_02295 [Lysobacter sp. TY2-98]|uniref:hypothetical protein n=1 Tax=Lysobacter sp. TY2-98 TaxID=2290922 RepID=UPI000E2076F4|nr:hypothetical protein [Lysobacter sp. TY2-98]AXK71230.1 hypothetical protein DWG18_02295 [Lysobacter sp. TY2-98]
MSDAIDAAALIIALSSFGLSVTQARGAARDRRMSVRPHLAFKRNSSPSGIRITLFNNGLGPAEILNLSYSVNGRVQQFEQESDIAPLLKASGINGCKIGTFVRMTPGDFFAPGSELVLVELTEVEPYEGHDLYGTAYGALNVHVKYRSLYGEEFYSSAHVNAGSHRPPVKG